MNNDGLNDKGFHCLDDRVSKVNVFIFLMQQQNLQGAFYYVYWYMKIVGTYLFKILFSFY